MKPILRSPAFTKGATLVELMIAVSIAVVVLGVLTYASIGLTRSGS